MMFYLAELLPSRKSDGVVVPLRYTSSPLGTVVDNTGWLPRLRVPYRRSVQVFDGAFSSQPQDFGSIEVALQTGDATLPVTGMAWGGRRARVWRGSPGQTLGQMRLVFDGDCEAVEAARGGFVVRLRGPGFAASKNALSLTYGGSGGPDGTPDLANNLRPLLLGRAAQIAPVRIDKPRGVFQYHAYGRGSLQAVLDAGSPLEHNGKNWATYAELMSNEPAPGQYSTCDALGMGRHGGPPIELLDVDATGGAPSGGIGDILSYLGALAGVPVQADVMAWLNSNLPHAQDNYVTEQVSFEDIMRDMMLKLGGYVWWTPEGRLSAGLVRRGATAASVSLGPLNLQTAVVRPTAPPFYRRRMGYRRTRSVRQLGELRTEKPINPRGKWLATTKYAYYDLVQHKGSSWLYYFDQETTGNEPVDGSNFWKLFVPGITKTSELLDDAKLGLTALWPNVGGDGRPRDNADVTGVNTALNIFGQGALATLGALLFGGPYLLESSGIRATMEAFKTALGTAQFFSGQGSLATLSNLALGSAYLTGFGLLAGKTYIKIGAGGGDSGQLLTANGFNTSDFQLITAQGTAQFVAGQGSLATRSNVTMGSPRTGVPGSDIVNIYGTPLVDDHLFTAFGTAAFFNGQGILATSSFVQFGQSTTVRRENGETVTDTTVVTAVGTALFVAGQGRLATKDRIGGGDFDVFYNGQGGRVEINGNGVRVYSNSGRLRVRLGF